MQKVHELLQPIEIDTHACHGDMRRLGNAEGNTSVCSRISKAGPAVGFTQESRQAREVVGAEHHVHVGGPSSG